jgi:prepilin-type N-terminal cleavage/methylation domain-containing protein/prepilin-type processing-associated H-X9-DG protein
MLKPRTRAFTLVELLVVIAIIGILIALLLPAVQAAREAARRSQCTNNIKQLALALHNYHDSYKRFPSGSTKLSADQGAPTDMGQFSWIVKILPYIEGTSLHDLVDYQWADTSVGTGGTPHPSRLAGLFAQPLSVVYCPSDDMTPVTNGTIDSFPAAPQGFAPNNMVGCSGSDMYFKATNNGPNNRRGLMEKNFWPSFASVKDGTSNTMAISECLTNEPFMLDIETADIGGCMAGTDGQVLSSSGNKRGKSWAQGNDSENHLFNTLIPINDKLTENHECLVNTYVGAYAARSHHPGGVNVGMVDGSVTFATETFDIDLWRAASTIAGMGSEPIFSGFE